MIVPQLGAEVVDEDITLGPVTDPHALVVEALLKQFLASMKEVLPLLFQDAAASDGAIAKLEGLAGSIQCFDAPLYDRLKLMIDRQ